MAVNVNSEANNFEEFQKIQKFKKYIKSEYDKYFKEWYIDFERINNSKLLILVDEFGFCTGYCKSCKTIMLSQNTGNLDDIEESFHNDWPSWKKELIHEMLHEYQDKVNFDATPEGSALFREFQETQTIPKISINGIGFEGAGHDERFYTLICLFSVKFNLSPINFKKQL